jgi:hypothetical protein
MQRTSPFIGSTSAQQVPVLDQAYRLLVLGNFSTSMSEYLYFIVKITAHSNIKCSDMNGTTVNIFRFTFGWKHTFSKEH